MKQRQPISLMSQLRSTIRNSGLRSTAPRVAVLQYLRDTSTPMTHAEICEALEEKGFDRATLYRNLIDLTEVGLLLRTDVGDHVWRFELCREGRRGHRSEHPHFMCTDCGEISCLPGVNVHISPTRGIPRALAKKNIVVQMKGLCDRCAA
jgi:Fur family transcriptional regulator, ferric uptake regulator